MTAPMTASLGIEHLDQGWMCSNPYHIPRVAAFWIQIHTCIDYLACAPCWHVYREIMEPAFVTGEMVDGSPFDRRCRSCSVTFPTFDAWCTAVTL